MSDFVTSILIKVLDSFTAPLRKLDEELKDVDKTAEKVEKRFKLAADLNQAAEAAGRFGNALLGPIKAAVNEFAGFDHALSKLSAMTDEARGSKGFEQLKQQALDLGAATQYSAQEVAELQTELATGGYATNEILAVTESTLAAATASGLGLAQTAGIVASAVKGMGYDVSQTERVLDVLSKVSAKGATDLQGLSEGLTYVGPIAAKSKTSIETTAAMLGKLADEGIKGGSAGAALRNVLLGFAAPTRVAKKAFAEMGIPLAKLKKLQDDVAEGRLNEALAVMGDKLNKLSGAKQLELLDHIFGKENASASAVLIKASMDGGFAALKAEADNAKGSTKQMAKVMQDDLQGSFERASGAVSGLATAAGEALAPTAKKAAEALEGISGWATQFVKDYPTFSKATMELTAGLGGLGIVMQGGLTAMSTYQSAMGGLTKGYETMSKSLGGQFGLVALAGAAGVLVGTWANETLGLDKAIAGLAGRKTPEEAKKGSPVQTFAGGWEINARTGEVVKMGTGVGPAAVRRARAKGAVTQAELSGVIGIEKTAEINTPMSERVEEEKRKYMGTFSPLLEAPTKTRPKVLLPETPQESAAAEATKQQTEKLLEELREQAKQQKRVAEAMEKLAYLSPGGPRLAPERH